MFRRLSTLVLALALVSGCAGSARLTKHSEEKLARGDAWQAWRLATRALDKEPGNPRSRAAATAAGAAIAEEWQRRVHALAQVDSLEAAEQVLEFADFRADAARYATLPVASDWPVAERALRGTAARTYYQRGVTSLHSGRPRKAYADLSAVERYVSGYRDAGTLASRALERGLTRVALIPFRASAEDATLGMQVTQAWRDELAHDLAPPTACFTRLLGGASIDDAMTVSQLGSLSRDAAVRLGRRAGAQRIVLGSIGGVRSATHLDLFKDTVARRVTERDAEGNPVTRWVDVPIEVVARVRDVTVGVDYEIVATRDGASLGHQHLERSGSARAVWTSYQPVGDAASYALISETDRADHPDRARALETRWKAVCGDATTLAQVLEARRSSGGESRYRRETLSRFIAGAAVVFLEDLPPASDLAFAALARGAGPLRADLLRMDAVDDVDLGVTASDADPR